MKKPDWSHRTNEMNIGYLMLEIVHLLSNWLQEIRLPLSVAGSGKGSMIKGDGNGSECLSSN